VVGNKKPGDYNPKYIVKSYDIMKKDIYPEEKIVFGVFSTYSRYAGTKEAIFTAICRKNFGCSHFIIGRDHTGVGDLFESNIQQNILSSISDLGIEIVKFNTVYYSKKNKSYVEGTSNNNSSNNDLISINGSDIRMMFNENKMPPELYMRPEISKMILESIKANEPVFVK
jgi:ATP sulfurylase